MRMATGEPFSTVTCSGVTMDSRSRGIPFQARDRTVTWTPAAVATAASGSPARRCASGAGTSLGVCAQPATRTRRAKKRLPVSLMACIGASFLRRIALRSRARQRRGVLRKYTSVARRTGLTAQSEAPEFVEAGIAPDSHPVEVEQALAAVHDSSHRRAIAGLRCRALDPLAHRVVGIGEHLDRRMKLRLQLALGGGQRLPHALVRLFGEVGVIDAVRADLHPS